MIIPTNMDEERFPFDSDDPCFKLAYQDNQADIAFLYRLLARGQFMPKEPFYCRHEKVCLVYVVEYVRQQRHEWKRTGEPPVPCMTERLSGRQKQESFYFYLQRRTCRAQMQ